MSTCSCVFVCVLNDDWCLRTEREREREREGAAQGQQGLLLVFLLRLCVFCCIIFFDLCLCVCMFSQHK